MQNKRIKEHRAGNIQAPPCNDFNSKSVLNHHHELNEPNDPNYPNDLNHPNHLKHPNHLNELNDHRLEDGGFVGRLKPTKD